MAVPANLTFRVHNSGLLSTAAARTVGVGLTSPSRRARNAFKWQVCDCVGNISGPARGATLAVGFRHGLAAVVHFVLSCAVMDEAWLTWHALEMLERCDNRQMDAERLTRLAVSQNEGPSAAAQMERKLGTG